jgi:outer membrane protein TolC
MDKRKITTILMFFALSLPLTAQTLSLKQCIEYAKQNNSNIKIASLNSEVSGKQVNEQIGNALPQIDIDGSLTNNLIVTTSLLPAEFIGGEPGTFIPVKMGTKYSAIGTIQLTQKIFDPSVWIGLKAAKLNADLSLQNIQQTDEQTFYNVSSAYYRAMVIQKQVDNLHAILAASEQSLKSTELRNKNGMARKIDVDKIRVSYNNTKSQVEETELNCKQALNNLKYSMGMSVDSTIVISDSLAENIAEIYGGSEEISNNYFENRTDYQMRKTTVALYEADKLNNIAAYLPTVSIFANYGYQAMRSEFDVFNSGKEWYTSSAIGLNLKIPIFSGFERLAKVEQSQLNIEVAQENLRLSEQSIKVEFSNYTIQYRTALDNIQNEKENLALAESVYKTTQLEFAQGTGSSLDLVQAESSLRETQNNYYNKLLTLYVAKLDKKKAKGTLINYINNLK